MHAFNKRYRPTLLKGLTHLTWGGLSLTLLLFVFTAMTLNQGSKPGIALLLFVLALVVGTLTVFEHRTRNQKRIISSRIIGKQDMNKGTLEL